MYQAFFKWDGTSGSRALIGIAMIQTLLVSEIITVILRMLFLRIQLKPYFKEIALTYVIIGVIFLVLNMRKYAGKYSDYQDHWKNEPEGKRTLRGILVVLSLIAPWMLFFIMTNILG
ncbi:MAG: hypothetical protein ACTHJ8_13090 [Mucilaginibacter sp.]|jgi:hypothetical protein